VRWRQEDLVGRAAGVVASLMIASGREERLRSKEVDLELPWCRSGLGK
jgi:hypothetical protein